MAYQLTIKELNTWGCAGRVFKTGTHIIDDPAIVASAKRVRFGVSIINIGNQRAVTPIEPDEDPVVQLDANDAPVDEEEEPASKALDMSFKTGEPVSRKRS